VGKGHQGKATLGRAGVLGMSKWHLAVQIQTPNCRIWLGVPMDITCGCEVEHHPLSPPGRPPRPGWGRPPGRSAQCTRIPVWWALGGRLWRMSLAPTAQPRGRGACCGAENSRRQKIGGYTLYDPPLQFHKDDATKSASAQGMLRATRRLRRPPGPPASRACGSIDRKRHRTLRRLAASLEIISANPRRAPAVSAFNAPHSHW
jgi:hypothetical protein